MGKLSGSICAVFGCNNYANGESVIATNTRFHSFPKDDRCDLWKLLCHRSDLIFSNADRVTLSKNYRICSHHFSNLQYNNTADRSSSLRCDAYPDRNLPSFSEVNACESPVRGNPLPIPICNTLQAATAANSADEHQQENECEIEELFKCKKADGRLRKPENVRYRSSKRKLAKIQALKCCISGCDSDSTDNVTFHSFPNDPETRLAWIYGTKLGHGLSWQPDPTDTVCSQHFDQSISEAESKPCEALPIVEHCLQDGDAGQFYGTEPTIFKGAIDRWPARNWTLESLATTELQNTELVVRIGKALQQDVQFETQCEYVSCSLQDVCDWLARGDLHEYSMAQRHPSSTNPLHEYSMAEYWCYADYKYMKDVFSDQPQVLQAVDWSSLGLPGRDGYESTLWMGTTGCYTVAHYDTYGCNLVAQIQGRKRWTLFPPSQSPLMYPTRAPYEESSVFSQVNWRNPDNQKYPRIQDSTPYVVDLVPGDVLFVPRHWWHFVECLEPAISVNTWIPLVSDADERVSESLVKFLVQKFVSSENVQELLNPTEQSKLCDDTDCGYELTLVNTAIRQVLQPAPHTHVTQRGEPPHTHLTPGAKVTQSDGDTTPVKRRRLDPPGHNHLFKPRVLLSLATDQLLSLHKQAVPRYTYTDYINRYHPKGGLGCVETHPRDTGCVKTHPMGALAYGGTHPRNTVVVGEGRKVMDNEGLEVTHENILNCFLDREVLQLVKTKLLNKFNV